MDYTPENVDKIADSIVNDMSLDDLRQYVYEDLCSIMLEDKEVFDCNVEDYIEETE